MEKRSGVERKDARRDGKYYNSVLNARIRTRLDVLQWSAVDLQRELANAGRSTPLSISAEAVRQWISGYSQPKIDNIHTIAESMHCSVAYLLGETDCPDIPAERMTLEVLGFSWEAIQNLVSIAGAAAAYLENPVGAEKIAMTCANPHQYSLKQEAFAFFFLNRFLENQDCRKVLSNAMQYVMKVGAIDRDKQMTISLESKDGKEIEEISGPSSILVDALWNRVKDPLLEIAEAIARKEVDDNGKKDK